MLLAKTNIYCKEGKTERRRVVFYQYRCHQAQWAETCHKRSSVFHSTSNHWLNRYNTNPKPEESTHPTRADMILMKVSKCCTDILLIISENIKTYLAHAAKSSGIDQVTSHNYHFLYFLSRQPNLVFTSFRWRNLPELSYLNLQPNRLIPLGFILFCSILNFQKEIQREKCQLGNSMPFTSHMPSNSCHNS